MPGVDDRVIAGRQQEDARLVGAGLLVDDDRADQVPGSGVDAARKRPAPAQPIAAVDRAGRGRAERSRPSRSDCRATCPRSRPAPRAATCRAANDARRDWPAPRRSSRSPGRSPRPARRSSGTAIRCRRPALGCRMRKSPLRCRSSIVSSGSRRSSSVCAGALAQHRHQRLGARQELGEIRRLAAPRFPSSRRASRHPFRRRGAGVTPPRHLTLLAAPLYSPRHGSARGDLSMPGRSS